MKKQGDHVTLHNVRNFTWHPDGSYTEHWDTRSFESESNHWGQYHYLILDGPAKLPIPWSVLILPILHPDLSIEIPKEKMKEFSAIGGFLENMS